MDRDGRLPKIIKRVKEEPKCWLTCIFMSVLIHRTANKPEGNGHSGAGGWTLSASRTMTAWDSGNMRQSIRQDRFPHFVGIEFFSLQGDITAWGIEDYPASQVDAQDFTNDVNEAEVSVSPATSFRNNNRGLEEQSPRGRRSRGGGVKRQYGPSGGQPQAFSYCWN